MFLRGNTSERLTKRERKVSSTRCTVYTIPLPRSLFLPLIFSCMPSRAILQSKYMMADAGKRASEGSALCVSTSIHSCVASRQGER